MGCRGTILITVAIALAATACGGGSVSIEVDNGFGTAVIADSRPGAAGFDAGDAATVRATAASALAQFGNLETAATAILVAYDAGFSFDQIAAGVASEGFSSDGEIDGIEPELTMGALGVPMAMPVGFQDELDQDELDVDALRKALAEERTKLASRSLDDDSIRLYTELILWAIRDGFPYDAIVEAIVLGELTDATVAAIEERNREIRREPFRDQLDYCRMRSLMDASNPYALGYEECVLVETGSTLEELFGPVDETDSAEDELDEASTPVDELVALFDDSLGTQGNCVQRPDHDAISCVFTFSLEMNYRISALPREVVCFFPDIDSSTIFPIYDEPFPLDSLEGVVPFEAHATAWYDASSNPRFSNPVAIECQLSEPAGDGSTLRLDTAEFSFDLPGAAEPSHCVPAGHKDCSV